MSGVADESFFAISEEGFNTLRDVVDSLECLEDLTGAVALSMDRSRVQVSNLEPVLRLLYQAADLALVKTQYTARGHPIALHDL